jgi:hypothetical protein
LLQKITDIILSGLDGRSLCQQLRVANITAPSLMLTAWEQKMKWFGALTAELTTTWLNSLSNRIPGSKQNARKGQSRLTQDKNILTIAM